jgi:hypothetical protein
MSKSIKRKTTSTLAIVTAVAVVAGLAAYPPLMGSASASQLFETSVKLPPKTLTEKKPMSFTVNFGQTFASIDSVCFVFHFKNDLLDPGEEIIIFLADTSGFGFMNGFDFPQSERTICGSEPRFVELFLDGHEDFVLKMTSGSVKIESLTVQITTAEES